MNTASIAPISNITAAAPEWTREQRQLGRNYFTAGHPIIVCANAEQRRGWCEELNAVSDAETFSYLSSRGRR